MGGLACWREGVSLRCSTAHRVQRRQSARHTVEEHPENCQNGPTLQLNWRVGMPLTGRFALRLCDLHPPPITPITPITSATRRRGAGTHTQYLANLYRRFRTHQLRSPDLTDLIHLTCHGLVGPSRLVADAMLSHGNIEGTLDIVCFLFKRCAANPTALTSNRPLDVKSRERSVGRIERPRRQIFVVFAASPSMMLTNRFCSQR